MTTYVYRNGKVIDKRKAKYRDVGGAAYVISDEMDSTRHMANGKRYTSKAKFRQATRDAGCIEVGNETTTMLKPRKGTMPTRPERREAIRKQLRYLLHPN